MGLSGFSGSAAAMIQSLRNNKKQLTKRDSYFDKNIEHSEGVYGKFVDNKRMSPKEFKAFQEKLRIEELSRQRKLYIIFGIFMFFITAIVFYLMFFIKTAPIMTID